MRALKTPAPPSFGRGLVSHLAYRAARPSGRGDDDDTALGAGVGAAAEAATGLIVGLGALSLPGIGPIVAAGWVLSGTVAGGFAGGVGSTPARTLYPFGARGRRDMPVEAPSVEHDGQEPIL
jgi:hypothetical protein